MNTREKILSAGAARERLAAAATVPALVIGYFDPMLSAHARELEALGAPIWVAIAEPPEPLYSSKARMELAAALRCVVHVFEYEPGAEAWGFAAVHDLRSRHAALRDEFIHLVHERHER